MVSLKTMKRNNNSIELVSHTSIKALLLLFACAVFFALLLCFSIALAVEEEVGESPLDVTNLEKSTLAMEKKHSEDEGLKGPSDSIFDLIFGNKDQGGSDSSTTSDIASDEIRVQEIDTMNTQAVGATLRVIDKTLGKMYPIDVANGDKKTVNELTVKVIRCQQNPSATITPQSKALIEVYETKRRVMNKLFNGWVFSHMPSLNVVPHPKYDVSLAGCLLK